MLGPVDMHTCSQCNNKSASNICIVEGASQSDRLKEHVTVTYHASMVTAPHARLQAQVFTLTDLDKFNLQKARGQHLPSDCFPCTPVGERAIMGTLNGCCSWSCPEGCLLHIVLLSSAS